MRAWIAALVVGLLVSSPVHAGDLPDVDAGRSVDDRAVTAQLSGELALIALADEPFVQITASAVIAYRGWRFVPRVPVRFRLVDDRYPELGALRAQDWDEVGDFSRLLPKVSYGRDGELFHVRVGELPDATVGFGALVDRYDNTIDIDHYQTGVYASVNHPMMGGQLLVDDAFDPAVALLRFVARPLSWGPALPWPLGSLQLGVTLGADFRAPHVAAVGKLRPLMADAERRVVVSESEPLALFAADVSLPVDVFDDRLRLTPYVEVASLDFGTSGVHVGVIAAWRIDAMSHLRIRGEYRYHAAGHMPGYVSAFYDVERVAYARGRTKRSFAEQLGAAGHGFLLEADVKLPPWVGLGVQVAHDTAGGTDVRIDVSAPNMGPVELRGGIVALDIDGISDFDSVAAARGLKRLVAVGQVRIRIVDGLLLRGAIKHQWRLVDLIPADSASAGYEGDFAAGLDWEVGVVGQLRL